MSLKVDIIEEDVFILLEDVTVEVLGYRIKVKKGFDFDGASIPKALWSVYGNPLSGNFRIAALVHDVLYAGEVLDRKVCDDIFLDLMKQYKVSYLRRYTMYWAVRLGGGKVWKEHTKDEVLKYKYYCKVTPSK